MATARGRKKGVTRNEHGVAKSAKSGNSYFVSVQTRGVVALPVSLRKRHKLDEPGAQVELVERPDGVIELHPRIPIPADQAWFWTPDWQEGEREASEQVERGELTIHDGADGFLAALDALRGN